MIYEFYYDVRELGFFLFLGVFMDRCVVIM